MKNYEEEKDELPTKVPNAKFISAVNKLRAR